MNFTRIGNTTIVSNNDGPFALIYPSAWKLRDLPINVEWKDEINDLHFSMVESVEDGIRFIEARMAAIEIVRRGSDLLCPVMNEIAPTVPTRIVEAVVRRVMDGESLPDVLDSTPELSGAAS